MVDAIVADDVERVVALLEAGADPNATNERGETAFSYACANYALEAAKALFVHGAEINTLDACGGSPLDWAACWSSPEFRAWLIGIGGRRHDNSYDPWPWPPRSEGGCGRA
jgi:ankyrin repeat protein